YDFWAAISRDGGYSFGAPVRISHALSAPAPDGGDDFSHVALDGDYLYAAWADMRTSPTGASGDVRSLYFGRVALGAPTPVATLPARATEREGAQVVAEQPIGDRGVDLTIATTAFAAPTHVQVFLPAGYAADPARRWPVTYYLHGAQGDEKRFDAWYGDLIHG